MSFYISAIFLQKPTVFWGFWLIPRWVISDDKRKVSEIELNYKFKLNFRKHVCYISKTFCNFLQCVYLYTSINNKIISMTQLFNSNILKSNYLKTYMYYSSIKYTNWLSVIHKLCIFFVITHTLNLNRQIFMLWRIFFYYI